MFWRKNICKENMLGSVHKKGMDEILLQQSWVQSEHSLIHLKVHKIEIFFGFDFEICIISLLVM